MIDFVINTRVLWVFLDSRQLLTAEDVIHGPGFDPVFCIFVLKTILIFKIMFCPITFEPMKMGNYKNGCNKIFSGLHRVL